MARLGGKVTLVTGGASGIGRAIVERFVAEGASVVAGDIDEGGERPRPVRARVEHHGGPLLP